MRSSDHPPLDRARVTAPKAAAGLGLRPKHHDFVRAARPAATWFEVHAENFMRPGMLRADLDDICGAYALSMHAVGLSLGSAAGLDCDHLMRLRQLVDIYQPMLVSDHLSWSSALGVHIPDLLPLPYTEEALAVVVRNIAFAQEELGRTLLIENPSAYVRFAGAQLSEAEFLAEVVRRTGCGLLLDVNNVFVSASNLGMDARAALRELVSAAGQAIGEIHLAGHAVRTTSGGATLRIDDHGSEVPGEVWALYAEAIALLGGRPTLIEWDTDIPEFSVLQREAAKAQAVLDRTHGKEAQHARAR